MNRKQLIGYLVLEGWEPISCTGLKHTRQPTIRNWATMEFVAHERGEKAIREFIPSSNVSEAAVIGWSSVGSSVLMHAALGLGVSYEP